MKVYFTPACSGHELYYYYCCTGVVSADGQDRCNVSYAYTSSTQLLLYGVDDRVLSGFGSMKLRSRLGGRVGHVIVDASLRRDGHYSLTANTNRLLCPRQRCMSSRGPQAVGVVPGIKTSRVIV